MSCEVTADNDIYLTRGDTASLEIELLHEDTGEPYVLEEGDVVRLSMKHFISDRTVLVQKDIQDTLIIVIEPSDTSELDYGEYHYDISLMKPDGYIETFIENRNFVITPKV